MQNKEGLISATLLVIANAGIGVAIYFIYPSYEFADERFLYGLLLLPLLSFYLWWNRHRHRAALSHSTSSWMSTDSLPWKRFLHWFFQGLRVLALASIIFALARPQSSKSWEDRKAEGIDIIIAMDVSASMLAQDFKPNRLESSKEVAMDFIKARPDDRIGLVIYEAEPFTQVPLTTDHTVLERLFEQVQTGRLESGTAIGMGLATAVNRLKDSDAKSKVVILLSDGENNSGNIPPEDAADIARTLGVRVYTIGVGTNGMARQPVRIRSNGTYEYGRVQVNIDEETLQAMAEKTGGQYFRATSAQKLDRIYGEIDQLEKTRIQVTEYSKRSERYFPFALAGGGLLLLEFLVFSLLIKTIE